MIKSLKFLLLLATISCGYTSNINQNNLPEIDTNNNSINNLMQNNNINNNEQNNNTHLNKKLKSKKVKNKIKNNAYKYLFSNDNDNRYFQFPDDPAEVSNPEYEQFMENLYDLFHDCLYELFHEYNTTYREDIDHKVINRLKQIKVNLNQVAKVAKLFNFKFSDMNNCVFANNNISNLTKYIAHNRHEITKNGISFYNLYVEYLYNHIIKLYNQTTHALQKSINNHEQIDKQVQIVNEFCNTLNSVLYEIRGQIEYIEYRIPEEKKYNSNSKSKDKDNTHKLLSKISNDMEECSESEDKYGTYMYEDLLMWVDYYIGICIDLKLKQRIKEFNWYNKDFQKQFDNLHNDLIKVWLKELSESNESQNSSINTMDNQKLVNSNLQLFDDLLSGLNINNNNDVEQCKEFFVNGRKDVTIQKYLTELVDKLDILRSITDEKIKYQIAHEHTITYGKSVFCYESIIENILSYIREQLGENNELYEELMEISSDINHEMFVLCYKQESDED